VLAATIADALTTLNQRLSRHVLLPTLARARRDEPAALVDRFYAARRVLDGCFLPAALGLTLFSRPIVDLLYGTRYREVAWILALLGVLAATRCLSEPCEQLLVALGATRTIAAAQAGRAAWLLAAVPIAAAAFGAVGAVWAVGLSELPVLAILWWGLLDREAFRTRHELSALAFASAVALYAATW
jgi:O-antigen/teichoic acid export membrane protein